MLGRVCETQSDGKSPYDVDIEWFTLCSGSQDLYRALAPSHPCSRRFVVFDRQQQPRFVCAECNVADVILLLLLLCQHGARYRFANCICNSF